MCHDETVKTMRLYLKNLVQLGKDDPERARQESIESLKRIGVLHSFFPLYDYRSISSFFSSLCGKDLCFADTYDFYCSFHFLVT